MAQSVVDRESRRRFHDVVQRKSIDFGLRASTISICTAEDSANFLVLLSSVVMARIFQQLVLTVLLLFISIALAVFISPYLQTTDVGMYTFLSK